MLKWIQPFKGFSFFNRTKLKQINILNFIKMKIRILFFSMLLTMFTSCVVVKPTPIEILDGKTKKDLVQKFGVANQKSDDENGGEIYTYSKNEYKNIIVRINSINVMESRLFTITTQYFIDKNGVIYKTLRTENPIPQGH